MWGVHVEGDDEVVGGRLLVSSPALEGNRSLGDDCCVNG